MPEISLNPSSSPPDPPPKTSVMSEFFNILVTGMICIFALKAFIESDWIIFAIDSLLIFVNVYFFFLRRKSRKRMHKMYAVVKEAYEISVVPVFRRDEETDTTFITVVGPSPKLISEMNDIKREAMRIMKGK